MSVKGVCGFKQLKHVNKKTLFQIRRLPFKMRRLFWAPLHDGELDWKVIAISANDPKAADINDVADVEKHFPGELEKIRVWFRHGGRKRGGGHAKSGRQAGKTRRSQGWWAARRA